MSSNSHPPKDDQPNQRFELQAIHNSAGPQPTNKPAPREGSFSKDSTHPHLPPRYTILRELGCGGMGRVYLASDSVISRQVAIKVMRIEKGYSHEWFERFAKELKAAGQVTHPNIVTVYDADGTADPPYLVMEYVDGGDLLKLCDGKLQYDRVLEIAIHLCEGLVAVHKRNLIHRDIKPANVLLTSQGIPKLTDFGLAKEFQQSQQSSSSLVLGTPYYLSPEQASNPKSVDQRSDIYSLGATLYHLATGLVPQTIRLDKIKNFALAKIIEKALAAYSERYASSSELLSDLKRLKDHPEINTGKVLEGWVQEGECFDCHEINPIDRKHCKKCASKLRVCCLQCDGTIPVWDNVCDHCGCIQAQQYKNILEDWNSRQTIAGRFLGLNNFHEAMHTIEAIQIPNGDPRFKQQNEELLRFRSTLLETKRLFSECTTRMFGILDNEGIDNAIRYLERQIEANPWLAKMRVDPTEPTIAERLESLFAQRKEKEEAERRVQSPRVAQKDSARKDSEETNSPTPQPAPFGTAIPSRKNPPLKRYASFVFLTLLAFPIFWLSNFQTNNFSVAWVTRLFQNPAADIPQALKENHNKNEVTNALTETNIASSSNTLEQQKSPVNLDKPIDEETRSSQTDREPANASSSDASPDLANTTDSTDASTSIGIPSLPSMVNNAPEATQQPTPIDDTPIVENPENYTNSLEMEFRLIQPGEFVMGNEESNEELSKAFTGSDAKWFETASPRHPVKVSEAFYMGCCEVTVGQFRRFVDATNYRTEAEKDGKGGWGYNGKILEQSQRYSWKSTGFTQTDEHPVVNVSWNDCIAFTKWLSDKEGRYYDLPTEVQWEYACRAGTQSRYWSGLDSESLTKIANVGDRSLKSKLADDRKLLNADDGFVFSSPVGQFPANPWGLHDMHGNVNEWCRDTYKTYPGSVSTSNSSLQKSEGRVYRGGSWFSLAAFCRSASRDAFSSSNRSSLLGFRVVLSPTNNAGKATTPLAN